MPIAVLVHMMNEDPIRAEMDELPAQSDNFIVVNNPRRRDGKDVSYVLQDVVTVLFPIHRVSFIEILPTAQEEDLIGFVRE